MFTCQLDIAVAKPGAPLLAEIDSSTELPALPIPETRGFEVLERCWADFDGRWVLSAKSKALPLSGG